MSTTARPVNREAFRPELVSLRRRMLGLSQADVEAASGISQSSLSKIEQGLRDPETPVIEKLAGALSCPASFFFQAEREYGSPLSVHPMFRKNMSVGQKVIDRTIAEFNVRIAHIRTMLSALEFTPELPLPQYDVDEFDGGAEAIAENVRRSWYVPRGPIRSLTEYAERAGCIVVLIEMEAARIDGVSYRVPGLPPIVFLNRRQPADRMRFSLAHELGHLIMHRYPEPEMEKQANDFASALLLPRRDIAPDLQGLNLAKAAYMKPVWRVSMAALIMAASRYGKLDKYQSDYLWRQMAAKGYRLLEPVEIAPEQPSLMKGLVANLTERQDFSADDLTKTLHLHFEELARMYELQQHQAGLRRVK